MNILYVCPFSHALNISPALHLAQLLANDGHHVHFYSVKTPYVVFKDHSLISKVARTPENVNMHFIENTYPVSNIAYPLINVFQEFRDLQRIIKEYDIDILHFYFPEHLFSLPILKKESLGNLPIVLTVCGLPGYGWSYNDKIVDLIGKTYVKMFSRRIIEKANLVVPLSSQVREEMVRLGVDEDKLVDNLNPYGIDTSHFKPCENKHELREKFHLPLDAFIVTYAGRLVKLKQVDVFIKLLGDLQKAIPELVFLCIGDGPEKEELVKLSRSFNYNNIIFREFVPQDTLAQMLSACDIFLLLSKGEGNPHILLEAGSVGLPIIATNVGGCGDIVKPCHNGFLLESVSSETLEECIVTIRDNYNEYSTAARQYMLDNFEWNQIKQNYLSLYIQLLGEL